MFIIFRLSSCNPFRLSSLPLPSPLRPSSAERDSCPLPLPSCLPTSGFLPSGKFVSPLLLLLGGSGRVEVWSEAAAGSSVSWSVGSEWRVTSSLPGRVTIAVRMS